MTPGLAGARTRMWALLVAPVPLCVLLLVAAAGTPGYHHAAETISALGAPGRPMAVVARLAIAGYGVVVLLAAGELRGRAPDRPRVLRWTVATYGAAAVVAGAVPKVLPGRPTSAASHVHVVAALVGGAALFVAMYLVAAGGSSTTERVVATVAALVVAIGSVVFRQTWGTEAYGIAERVVLGTGVAWLSWVAWWTVAELDAARPGVRPRL